MILKRKKFVLKSVVHLLIGNFILALATELFIIPNRIVTGGVAGVAVILDPFISVSSTYVVYFLNIVLFILGWFVLGRDFALKTAASTFLYPIFISVISFITKDAVMVENPIIASLYGGILTGIGIGVVFLINGSTGGMDVVPFVINKYTGTNLSVLVFLVDFFTVALGFKVYGMEITLIGIISVWSGSFMINKTMMFGSSAAQQVTIISKESQEISEKLQEELDRGSTFYYGRGGYTQDITDILMIVIAKRQYPKLQQIVHDIDSRAFVIASEVQEVKGLGFTEEEL